MANQTSAPQITMPPWLAAPPREIGDSLPEVVEQMRLSAHRRWLKHGLPTTRLEDWRNTSLAVLEQSAYDAPAKEPGISSDNLQDYLLDDNPCAVLVNGRYSTDLSAIAGLPEGVHMGSLHTALTEEPEKVLSALGQIASLDDHPMAVLNTAQWEDGIWLQVDAGVVVEQPVQLLVMAAAGDQPIATYPRIVISLGENSQVTILERYLSIGEVHRFTSPVTEISLAPGAVAEHVRLQDEGAGAIHTGLLQVQLSAGSTLRTTGISVSGDLLRNDIHATLAGEGASVEMAGLYLLKGREHVDNHTRMDHVAPHGSSNQQFKGILDDQSHGVFTGRVVVHPEAQQTDAQQTNRNLMLSDTALVHTDPQLEIFADDVKCSHGATVGQVDPEALFYFMTRGIDEVAARRLLIRGFAEEVLHQIRHSALRAVADELVHNWLADGESL